MIMHSQATYIELVAS